MLGRLGRGAPHALLLAQRRRARGQLRRAAGPTHGSRLPGESGSSAGWLGRDPRNAWHAPVQGAACRAHNAHLCPSMPSPETLDVGPPRRCGARPHLLQLGAAIYASKFPERWKPGAFDFAFHSHQLFHVAWSWLQSSTTRRPASCCTGGTPRGGASRLTRRRQACSQRWHSAVVRGHIPAGCFSLISPHSSVYMSPSFSKRSHRRAQRRRASPACSLASFELLLRQAWHLLTFVPFKDPFRSPCVASAAATAHRFMLAAQYPSPSHLFCATSMRFSSAPPAGLVPQAFCKTPFPT